MARLPSTTWSMLTESLYVDPPTSTQNTTLLSPSHTCVLILYLQETSYDKKSYLGHIKAYLKKLSEKIAAEGKDVKAFQASAQEFVKKVNAKFDDYAFFTGESV